MRIYVASDFHAAEKAWRKFLNAIRMNVYKADVALVAGDLTGKAIVPIVRSNGGYEAELFGVHRRGGRGGGGGRPPGPPPPPPPPPPLPPPPPPQPPRGPPAAPPLRHFVSSRCRFPPGS